MEILLEIVLTGLLAATLVYALRLERALGVLKRDRSALEELVAGFNASTRQAEAGIERLRGAAEGAGRQITQQLDEARALKDDMAFLLERGSRLADRLDSLVRVGRPLAVEPRRPMGRPVTKEAPVTHEAEPVVSVAPAITASKAASASQAVPASKMTLPSKMAPRSKVPPPSQAAPRSQAERDLLQALRMVR
jgi:hypothetical protein